MQRDPEWRALFEAGNEACNGWKGSCNCMICTKPLGPCSPGARRVWGLSRISPIVGRFQVQAI